MGAGTSACPCFSFSVFIYNRYEYAYSNPTLHDEKDIPLFGSAMMPVLASAQQVANSAPKASEATAVPTAGAEAPSAIRFGYFSFEEVFRTMPYGMR